MALSLSPKQRWSIREANKRINLWEGSVRSSKTWASLFAWIRYIGHAPDGDLLMTGKTDRALYRNVIKPMQNFLGSDFKYWQGRGEASLWGRTIHIVGANDERSEGKIRGMTCAGAYGDEVSLWPQSFFKMMLSRMSMEGSQFFGTTNPDSPYHWLKTDFIDRVTELDMASFHFLIDDNPFLPKSYIENLKNEYIGLWYKRFILGLWVIAEGAIYDFWNEKIHCIKRRPIAKNWYCSIDYGTGNPTGFGLFGYNPNSMPRIWLDREYFYDARAVGRSKTDSEFSADLKEFLGDIVPKKIIVDPSALSFKTQLKRDGFLFVQDANNDVLDGIRTQARLLKNGTYAVGDDCEHTKKEYGGYVWDERAQKRGEDKPIKENDHTKDFERYMLHTVFGDKKLDLEKLTTV